MLGLDWSSYLQLNYTVIFILIENLIVSVVVVEI